MEEEDRDSQEKDEGESLLGVDLMAISQEVVQGIVNMRTLRLQGTIQNQAVVMLVDSGSSHCFMSEEFSRRLSGEQRSIHPALVRVANGALLKCVREFPFCQWEIQGHSFYTTFRVLPLQCYDIILGINWLEQHSPTNIHWLRKILSYGYKG